MRVFLASTTLSYVEDTLKGGDLNWKPYILESFYYVNESEFERVSPYFGDFMLDSGAFTFMGGFSYKENTSKRLNWEEYIERYCDFIVKYNIDKFFELDIDVVVGYDQVKQYRRMIERLTNKQPIPVWHSARGVEEFKRMCDEYPYVALGGIVGGEWSSKAEKYIPWFIDHAHSKGVKIHGLGYTKLKKLREYHFDSVDSTSWVSGNQYGAVHKFNGKSITRILKPKGHRVSSMKNLAINNFTEWVKFQKWADTHL